MSKTCYIVASRPDTPEKYKLTISNLEALRKNTDCPIILSTNLYPYGIENYKGELYDYLIHSDINEIYQNKKGSFGYTCVTDVFRWETNYSEEDAFDYGRAVNNLYLRGAQLAKSLGYSEFVFFNYDIKVLDQTFTSLLESKSHLFLEGHPSSDGTPIFETWCFKLNKDLLQVLEYFSLEKNYDDSMDLNKEDIGFYEILIRNYFSKNNINVDYLSVSQVKELNVDFDNNFHSFRCCEHDGNVLLLAEYISSYYSRIVKIEFKDQIYDLGDCKGNWHLINLGPFYEGMEYKATINNDSKVTKLTKKFLSQNTIKFN